MSAKLSPINDEHQNITSLGSYEIIDGKVKIIFPIFIEDKKVKKVEKVKCDKKVKDNKKLKDGSCICKTIEMILKDEINQIRLYDLHKIINEDNDSGKKITKNQITDFIKESEYNDIMIFVKKGEMDGIKNDTYIIKK